MLRTPKLEVLKSYPTVERTKRHSLVIEFLFKGILRVQHDV